MNKMLSIAEGFQYSVNIAYDLNRDEKIKNFIPTPSSLRLLEEILLSTERESTDRARILIGAYGKGKSHIVLMILSLLLQKEPALFEKLNAKIVDDTRIRQCIQNYYDSGKKLLPVLITGSSTSISQAFLLALERTLMEHGLMDIMPETNFKAANSTIEMWKNDYPMTYDKFVKAISKPIDIFRDNLTNFDTIAYEEFERIYPSLTSGSTFNPFLGFDIVVLYESVVKSIKNKGYAGIYVVYDEFSKYLETNITKATVSDTKLLQDFAEKCCRSGDEQLHLMLISHKDIANYIDKLPKQKIDGWRGVSERFKHIYLNNNFARTYEIIASVIIKDRVKWADFCRNNKAYFDTLIEKYQNHQMFTEDGEEFEKTVYDCYPLHPVTTYILPRLSELVAQNERTLFSFLSANEDNTVKKLLGRMKQHQFQVVTPDLVFDYFEPQIRKEIYAEDIHSTFILTKRVLDKIDDNSLESKIVKTISLIYILAQFEKLAPTREEIVAVFYLCYPVELIEKAIDDLITKEYVVYLKRSNNYLCLKQTSGVDIKKEIENTIAQQEGSFSVKQVLNEVNNNAYMYPSRYNDEREITRYFEFQFIDGDEITEEVNWELKNEKSDADGLIYGIVLNNTDNVQKLKDTLIVTSNTADRTIFILLKDYEEIEAVVKEYKAVDTLKQKVTDDQVLFDEYEVVYEDLRDVISNYISAYTQPEKLQATYIYAGHEMNVTRKAALSDLMSSICDNVFSETPVINNEAINKNNPSNNSINSRNKIVAGLLRNELEPNLGLIGSGQEVSIMRSTLLRTGILEQDHGITRINLQPADMHIRNMLDVIIGFVMNAKTLGSANFAELYHDLTTTAMHIGLRKGVIPIYIAAVFHELKKELIIYNANGQVPINADTLMQINSKPEDFVLIYLNWTPEKEQFITDLASLFRKNVLEMERKINSYDYVFQAMKRWYLGLPKYAKEARKTLDGKNINRAYLKFLQLLKQADNGSEVLFNDIPKLFNDNGNFDVTLIKKIKEAKVFYDSLLNNLKNTLINSVKGTFATTKNEEKFDKVSMASVIKDWCDTLDHNVFEQLFNNGTEKCLNIFKNITHDEGTEVANLAQLATGLRVEDWDDSTFKRFVEQLQLYKETAEGFEINLFDTNKTNTNAKQYQLTFSDEQGNAVVKRFERVETTPRGKLLYNTITGDLDAMGAAISEQEKRQILMEILKTLC